MASKRSAGDKTGGPGKKPAGKAVNVKGSENRLGKDFESDTAMEILGDLYPQLLEVCVDEDGDVDTRAIFEVLAGLTGLFLADYQDYYGHEKSMDAMQDLVDLALNLYHSRVEQAE